MADNQEIIDRVDRLQEGVSNLQEDHNLVLDFLEIIVRESGWTVPEKQQAALAKRERATLGQVAPTLQVVAPHKSASPEERPDRRRRR
jgi:hypothetical protein